MGVARTVEIDASAGPIFGSLTKQAREASFLKPKEVVLTFDDGPMPWITKSILDTLDTFCTKATFFSVGKMALAYPETVREVLARGHTLGSHTYSHPYNLGRMKQAKAEDEIERGLGAVATAAGVPIAPFFRFTGLADSAALLGYLQTRHIATFSVDVVSNDSYINDPQHLIAFTLKEIEEAKGGIILFHDIKPTTAKALPEILTALQARGYRVVHLTSKGAAVPLSPLMVELAPKLARSETNSNKKLLPFYGAIGPEKPETAAGLEVTSISSVPRDRKAMAKTVTKVTESKPVVRQKANVIAEPRQSTGAGTLGWKGSVVEEPGDETAGETINPPVFVSEAPEPDPDPELDSAWVTDVRPVHRKAAH